MLRRELMEMAKGLVAGDKVRLTFKAGTLDKSSGKGGRIPKIVLDDVTKCSVIYLAMMKGTNVLMAEGEWVMMYAIGSSGHYQRQSDLTVTVEIPEEFDPQWFATRLAEGLESAEKLAT